MRSLSIAVAAAALVSAAAVSAQAQGYQGQKYPPIVHAAPPWMQDDGSSSDYPTHIPSDFSGDTLNHAYRNGLTVLPPEN
jgi:hypothetical protein